MTTIIQRRLYYSSGRVIRTDADLLNRANLGIQAMNAPNTHNFPKLL